ncbi:DUF2207 domain-containing protein [Nocardiopsis sp. HNM0947]|uniref:DUF2207 domain-containing protein n=1 Tax=Nocardiopsis coralli TaxID=2772213 RepID=A0ABR9P4H4_9ACTN|nr:DUF2207 domain-containing protein [Nocardiopsis coralli]MBE2998743.1 DUF2207 domain-containing protein [Nocardiopsis coralli]
MWWVDSWRRAVAGATALLVLSSLVTAVLLSGAGGTPRAEAAAVPTTTVPGQAPGAADPGGAITNDIQLDLDGDGTLTARETLTFDGGAPDTFSRALTTAMLYDKEYDRRFEVENVRAVDPDGGTVPVETEQEGASLLVHLDTAGREQVELDYTVTGAVTEVSEGVQLEWRAVGAYSHHVETTDVTVNAPMPPEAVSCLAGEPRSAMYCTASDMGQDASVAHFLQADMSPADRLDIVVTYPEGTAEGAPDLDRRWSLASAFAITPTTATVFGLLLLLPAAGLVALVRIRGRDERALRKESAEGDHDPIEDRPGLLPRFHAPDDVHPGQIGTLIDERVDIADLTATVLDLAVRGHLRIEELPHHHFTSVDWRLVREEGGTDEPLLPSEELLMEALFGDDDTVTLSDLASARRSPHLPERVDRVRAQLYRDMVHLGWFARSPDQERGLWTTIGMAVTAAGVVLTGVLAAFTSLAFTGLAVVIVGAAVTAGAQYMPAKTRLGSSVYAHTMGFRDYLESERATQAPPERRVTFFSRYLPYAVIFDDVDRWAALLAEAASTDLTSDELDGDGLHWYTGPDGWRIREDFADSVSTFVVTLTGVITNTRRLRSLNRFKADS